MYIYMYWLLVAAVACVDSRLLFVPVQKVAIKYHDLS